MQAVTTIGLDIAKSVFQVHGIDAEGNVLIRRRLKRRYVLALFAKLPPCLVGIEACATSHHWSRELKALGHNVRLMPPAYVKPYVKRQKNDATDAEAICEAVTRANMRFVETKTPEQQGCLMLHRTRQLFIRQQTSVINAIRAHMAEFGIVAAVGRKGVEQLLAIATDASDQRVPELARACVATLGTQLRVLKAQILEFDRRILAWHRSDDTSRRLAALARHWLRLWLPVSLIPRPSDRGGTSQDRARAEAALERGQEQARKQTGRSLSAQPVHRRRTALTGRTHGCTDQRRGMTF
jgi:transposase